MHGGEILYMSGRGRRVCVCEYSGRHEGGKYPFPLSSGVGHEGGKEEGESLEGERRPPKAPVINLEKVAARGSMLLQEEKRA